MGPHRSPGVGGNGVLIVRVELLALPLALYRHGSLDEIVTCLDRRAHIPTLVAQFGILGGKVSFGNGIRVTILLLTSLHLSLTASQHFSLSPGGGVHVKVMTTVLVSVFI